MKLRQMGRLGGAIIIGTLVGTLALTAIGIDRVRIEGSYDRDAREVSDLIADILPPPQYVVEAFAIAAMVENEPGSLAEHRGDLARLKAQFDETSARWARSEIDPALKTAFTTRTNAEARGFFTEVETRFLPAAERGDRAAMTKSYLRLQRIFIAQRSGVRDLAEASRARQEAIYAEGRSTLKAMAWLVAALFLGAVAMILLSLRYFMRNAIDPVTRIAKSVGAMAAGDLESHRTDRHADNEIGEITRALEIFRQSLAERDALQSAQAEADKSRHEQMLKQERRAAMLRLADDFERSVGDIATRVASATSQLQTTASDMTGIAQRASTQTGEVSAQIGNASQGVTAAAAACDEFAMSIGEISQQTGHSADLARSATEAAQQANDTVSAMAAASQEVGGIVAVISNIAQRTNMLALNASIEAARSGEEGRGFAVVASEVKELAAQTSKATDAIVPKIEAIQQRAQASVSALQEIVAGIDRIQFATSSIASAVDQQSLSGTELARSIDLAARGTEAVAVNVVEVRATSQSADSAARQVFDSSGELEAQATALRSQVDAFLRQLRAA